MKVNSASIVICSYNRAALLRETIASLARMRMPSDCAVELVVVDNNSNDDTPQTVDAARRQVPFSIRFAQERRQGKSFALNRALSLASGDIICLTDDDVWPAADWLVRIVEQFRTRDVVFVFGKVLPRWGALPPAELLMTAAQDIWGPLALVDYGDTPTGYTSETAEGKRLPIGANLAFRRDVLERLGGWRTDLGKVNNTLISGEDHEIFIRLHRTGMFVGWYDPTIVVRHYVPPGRLTRSYFRRWFYWHGKTMQLMKDDLYRPLDMSKVPHVGGVPRFVYRLALEQTWRYLTKLGSRDSLGLLMDELLTIQYLGFIAQGWKRTLTRPWGKGWRDVPASPAFSAE